MGKLVKEDGKWVVKEAIKQFKSIDSLNKVQKEIEDEMEKIGVSQKDIDKIYNKIDEIWNEVKRLMTQAKRKNK